MTNEKDVFAEFPIIDKFFHFCVTVTIALIIALVFMAFWAALACVGYVIVQLVMWLL